MERTYELYLMYCVAANGGGVRCTSRRARTLRASTMRDALNAFREEIELNNRLLSIRFPDIWKSIEAGVETAWRVKCLFPVDIVSCFPDDDRYGQWS